MKPDPITRAEVEASPWGNTPGVAHFYTDTGVLALTIDSRPIPVDNPLYRLAAGYLYPSTTTPEGAPSNV